MMREALPVGEAVPRPYKLIGWLIVSIQKKAAAALFRAGRGARFTPSASMR